MGYYLCIDLKCFYASVECVLRGLDPFETPLVVADESRGKGAIVLAISPYLKKLGIKNRCRLFEIPQNIKYICAKPRMQKYIDFSCKIYECYLKYCSPSDIHVYSIDEAFLEMDSYMKLYNKTLIEIGKEIIREIYNVTGCMAACGAGDNMLLSKYALDILSKHSKDNISYLSQEILINNLWDHKPLTDFWQIGFNLAKRLNNMNLYTLKDIALSDCQNLKKEFGIIGIQIYNHAWGIDQTKIDDIKQFKPAAKSFSVNQTLLRNYNYIECLTVIKEMVESVVLELVDKKMYCKRMFLNIGYSKEVNKWMSKAITLDNYTNSYKEITKVIERLYLENILDYPIKTIGIGVSNLSYNKGIYYDLFNQDIPKIDKEEILCKTMNNIKNKYGKNSINRAMSYTHEATTRERNKLIGGHNADE